VAHGRRWAGSWMPSAWSTPCARIASVVHARAERAADTGRRRVLPGRGPDRNAIRGLRVQHDKIDGTSVLVLVHDLNIRMLSTSGRLLRDLTLDRALDYQPQAPT
jgi:hypothetical protein